MGEMKEWVAPPAVRAVALLGEGVLLFVAAVLLFVVAVRLSSARLFGRPAPEVLECPPPRCQSPNQPRSSRHQMPCQLYIL